MVPWTSPGRPSHPRSTEMVLVGYRDTGTLLIVIDPLTGREIVWIESFNVAGKAHPGIFKRDYVFLIDEWPLFYRRDRNGRLAMLVKRKILMASERRWRKIYGERLGEVTT